MCSCVKLKDEPVTSVLKKHEDHIMNLAPWKCLSFSVAINLHGGGDRAAAFLPHLISRDFFFHIR